MEKLIKIARKLQDMEMKWSLESGGYLAETKLKTEHYFELQIDADDNVILSRFDGDIFATKNEDLMIEFLIYQVNQKTAEDLRYKESTKGL